jgi:hypothetical protein
MNTLFHRSTLKLIMLLIAAWWSAHALAQGVDRGVVYTKADVERIIKRVETQSDGFRTAVDRRLDNSRLDGSEREDVINAQVRQLETRLDVLRAKFDRSDRWGETRAEVRDVLAAARDVQIAMYRGPFGRTLMGEWRSLKADLNRLAGIYNLPKL